MGLVSLVDPPKPRVAEAVQQCKTAGVGFAGLRVLCLMEGMGVCVCERGAGGRVHVCIDVWMIG